LYSIALLSQTIGVIGLTYVYAWLLNRTRSTFLMIVFHALTNALTFLLPPALGPWSLVVGIVPWIVVLGPMAGHASRLLDGRSPKSRSDVMTSGDAPVSPAQAYFGSAIFANQ
jgi:hypothetical protein